MSGERMTSGEARRNASLACGWESAVMHRAADALAAWEAEDAARAGMPELPRPWAAVSEKGGLHYWDGATAEQVRHNIREWSPCKDYGAVKVVRLAVVEVAEPVEERGPSGWWYAVERDGSVTQRTHAGVHRLVGAPDVGIVPPADRALVARLLGEVG